MKVSKYLSEENCVLLLSSSTKIEAISELSARLFDSGKIESLEQFVNDVVERESLGSTGIGHGIAIPHARTAAVKDFVIGFGRSKEGIDFGAIDGKPVYLIFLMGAAPGDLNFYLRIFAELSKLLMNPSFRSDLRNAATADKVIEAIKKYEA